MEPIALNKYNHKAKLIRMKGLYNKIKKYIELDERILTAEGGGFFRYSYISCRCNKKNRRGVDEGCLKSGEILNQSNFEIDCVYRYVHHLHNQIRLYGDDVHINILVEIIGLDNTIELLKYWILKNMNVTELLRKAVERLEKQKVVNLSYNKKQNGKQLKISP